MNIEFTRALKGKSSIAKQWNNYMAEGQEKVIQSDWEAAAVCYKKAYELAERSVCSNCQNSECYKTSINRYLVSADEYAAVMHQNQYHCALLALMESVTNQMAAAPNEQLKEFDQLLGKIEQMACS